MPEQGCAVFVVLKFACIPVLIALAGLALMHSIKDVCYLVEG
jgi:hypothetical protein